MFPRTMRVRIAMYGLLFMFWYVGAMMFIMYRMKGDDLDLLENEANKREKVRKEFQNNQ